MRRTQYIKCAECGDMVQVIYDSRERKAAPFSLMPHYTCKCGKLDATMQRSGLVNYTGEEAPLCHQDRQYTAEFYPEDILEFTPEETELINIIQNLGKQVEQLPGVSFYDMSSKEEIRIDIDYVTDNNEQITIKLKYNFTSESGIEADEVSSMHAELMEKLINMKSALDNILSNHKILEKPSKIYDDETLNFSAMHRTQIKLYDYEFIC